MMTSFVDGRIRIRDERIRRQDVASRLRGRLMSIKGVAEASVNPRVGSMLIHYDPAKTVTKDLLEAVREFTTTPEAGKEAKTWKMPALNMMLMPARRAANMGMLASLLATLLSALFHVKKLHVAAGLLFVFFWGIHLLRHKEMLFA